MFIDDYMPLEHLLPWVAKFAPDLENKDKLLTIQFLGGKTSSIFKKKITYFWQNDP